MTPFLFSGDDALRLTSFNSATGVTLTIEGRFRDVGGGVQPFARAHVPNTDRTTASTTVSMGVGELLEVQVRASAGTPRRGQCFVILEVVRGLTGSQVPLGALVQGYVTDTQRRGWPASAFELSTEGPGVIRSITGTNPAAGAEILETIPANARWRLLAFLATLVASAQAANRDPALTVDDGTTVVLRSPGGQNLAASSTTRLCWFAAGQRTTIAQDRTITPPIPNVWLPGGFQIATLTTNLQTLDDWSAPQLLVEELIED